MRRCWSIGALGLLLGCAQPVVFFDSMSPMQGTAAVTVQPQPPAPKPAPVEHEARIGLHAELSQSVLPADAEATLVARVRIRPDVLGEVPRHPVSVALVLDTSGSMAGEAIDEAKAAALEFADALGEHDRIALVAFHSVAETLVPLTPLDDGGREQVRKAIQGIEAVGTTDLGWGLRNGFEEVRKTLAEGGPARVVLLSDGKPNDPAAIFPELGIAAQQGITVTALGLGLDYDEELLGKIATTTGGGFHFAESPEELAKVFRNEVLGLQRVVGRNAALSLVAGPGVKIERVLGHEGASLNVGDLVEGRTRDVFVLLRAKGHRDGAPVELLDAHLSFHDAIAQKGRAVRTFVASKASASSDDVGGSHDRDVELHTARALAADDALRALTIVREGRLREARKLVDAAIKRAKLDAARFDDDVLRAKIGELVALKKALPEFVPPPMPSHHAMRRPGARPMRDFEPTAESVRAVKENHAAAMGELGF